jgi:signal transduction histidine kinase
MLLTELDRITQSTSPLRTGEELAAAYLELLPPPEEKHDQLYRVGRDIWALSPSGGRITALYRDATVTKLPELADLTPPAGTRVRLEPQVQPAAEPLAALPMGSLLPDFRLALYPIDPIAPVDSTRQASLYLWTAVAVLFLIAVATLLAGRYVAAQVRLAHLKNDLIATVSHELKTPLASMRVLLDTLIEGRATSPVQTSQYLWLIAGENHRLSRLIDNFLTFSRMERDRRAFEMSPIDPREVILGAYETIRERFEPPDQKLEIEVPATLPPIRGDRDALLTMLLNLLENAHKYTEPVKRVRLRAYNNNAHVYVEVTDNGIGIPRRSLDRIFDRFYQVDQNLSRKSGGCGLGLSIVRFILKAHGGDIHVSSTPGSGSTFTVRLPAVISSSSTQQRALAHAR